MVGCGVIDGWSGAGGDATPPPRPSEHIFLGRERRMQARARDLWLSLCGGRAMPTLGELHPTRIAPFAAHSLLIDLPPGPPGPSIAFVGRALREQAGIEPDRPGLGDIPEGSLLAALLRRYPEIIAYRAPVGFEAEIPATGGGSTVYRGILLPFGTDRERIGAIYGVLNWREVAAVEHQPDIAAALASVGTAPPAALRTALWEDRATVAPCPAGPARRLDQRLAAARTWAEVAAADRAPAGRQIHGALSAAYDLMLAARSDPAAYARLAGTDAPPDATAIVALVFGAAPTRRQGAHYATVLTYAERLGLGRGRLRAHLDGRAGGYVAVAADARRARRAVARAAETRIARVRPGPVADTVVLTPLPAAEAATTGAATPAEPRRRSLPPIRRAVA